MRMLGNITASAAMCARVSQLQDAGRMGDEHASLAKAFCTVRMRETVGWARELMGGNGILLENHVGRYVADAEAIYSYEGTREVNTPDRRPGDHRQQRDRLSTSAQRCRRSTGIVVRPGPPVGGRARPG